MYSFIVNPHSKSGAGKLIWNQLCPELKKQRTAYEVFFTEHPGHAEKLVRQITGDGGEHTIVVLGGDGTVNETVNGICDYNKVLLGYIPTGSSNDFARSLRLPKDPVKALNNILAPVNIRALDIGCLTYKGKTKHFAVSTGLGFDAAICHQAAVSKLKVFLNRINLGKLTYAGIALYRLFRDVPRTMTIKLDDKPAMTFESVYFTAVMNHPFEGGGFKFCPQARPDDRLLDVIVISGISRLKALLCLPTAFTGHHVHFKGIHIFQCSCADIDPVCALPVHTDGEPLFLQKHLHVSLLPEQLRVIIAP